MKAVSTLSSSQAAEFKNLRGNITILTTQIQDLVVENASLREEVSDLRSRISVLESRAISTNSTNIPLLVFRESTEKLKVELNAIAYGVPESTADTPAHMIRDDTSSLKNCLKDLSIPLPIDSKLIRLGNITLNKPRPLKIIFQAKTDVSQFLHKYITAIRDGESVPANFRIVRDKTTLERELLRNAYTELEQRKQEGELDFSVSYINGIPTLVKHRSNNRVFGSSQGKKSTHPVQIAF